MSRLSPTRLCAAAALAAALAAATPLALRAQESDALPFQAGRWAVELSGDEDLASVAFLRFTSPGGAWLFAPGVVVAGGERSLQDPFGGSEEAEISALGVDLRVGYRSYRPLGRGVLSHLGLGALGQWTKQEEELDDGSESEESTSSYGVYGELGGSYFFTPRFGVGASAVATFTFDHRELGTVVDSEIDAWTFALPATRLAVTIVF